MRNKLITITVLLSFCIGLVSLTTRPEWYIQVKCPVGSAEDYRWIIYYDTDGNGVADATLSRGCDGTVRWHDIPNDIIHYLGDATQSSNFPVGNNVVTDVDVTPILCENNEDGFFIEESYNGMPLYNLTIGCAPFPVFQLMPPPPEVSETPTNVDNSQLLEGIEVFPNPSVGDFSLINNTGMEIENIILVDVLGNIIDLNKYNYAGNEIHFENIELPVGSYVLRVNLSNNKVITKNLIIK